MAVAIRLSRGGAKKRPYYKIVVADQRERRDGKFIEQVGTYNPVLAKDSPDRVKLLEERIRHWLSVGAKPSDRVLRFLDAAGILERPARSNPKKGEPGDKAKERVEEKAEKAKAAEEAPTEEVAEEAPAEAEAPTEEVAGEAPVEEAVADEASADSEPPAEEAPAQEVVAEEAQAEVATPADEASSEGESAEAPAEGAEEAAPDEGAEEAAPDEGAEKAEQA